MSALARVPLPQLRVETLRDFDAFVALEADWNRVVEEAGLGHPFLRHEWMRSWWEAFAGERELHVLLLRDGDRLVGLAPLMRSRRRVLGVPVRCLESICNAQSPRFELPALVGTREACRAFWERLAAESDEWDLLLLAQLPAAGAELSELTRLAGESGFPLGTWASSDSPYVPCVGSWERHLATLRAKHRSNLRNRLKKVQALGAVEHTVLSGEDDALAALGDAFAMEAAAWKGAAGTAISSTAETEAFYRALAKRAARRGFLRLHFLSVGGRRIAFQYGFEYRRKALVQKLGYDPAFAAYSPQNLLCSLILEDCFARGLSEYEFLGDAEPWKLEWASATRPHSWLFVFGAGWKGRLLRDAKFRWLPKLKGGSLHRAARQFVVTLGATRLID